LWLRERDYAIRRFSEHRVTHSSAADDIPEESRRLLTPEQLASLREAAKRPLVSDQTIDIYAVFDQSPGASAFRFSPPGVTETSGPQP
jgi:hypothetical protein